MAHILSQRGNTPKKIVINIKREDGGASYGRNVSWITAFTIAIITFLVYLPALQNGFVRWDDHLYVSENQNIRFIDIRFLRWDITAVVASLWHPLTMFSLALDYALWGPNPFGYHLTNILFHSLNALLVFILTTRLIELKNIGKPKILIIAGITALLFGIHPTHVESVAWVSERKDVLCAFFSLMAVIKYLEYLRAEERRAAQVHYVFTIFFFVLSLMSKPMAVTLPAVLLIIDFYLSRQPLRRDALLEKVPFFLLSLIVSLITIYVQGSALMAIEKYPLPSRIFVSMESYLFYIIKMFFPYNLAPFYPYPLSEGLLTLRFFAYLLGFLSITCFCIWKLKTEKGYLSIWLYYVITLLPAIGIIKVGGAAAADRYMYLPSIGVFIGLSVGVVVLYDRLRHNKRIGLIFITIIIIGLFILKTTRQISIWKDSVTLWTHQIKLYPSNSLAYVNRGAAFSAKNDVWKAIADYDKAIELSPRKYEAYVYRANIYFSLGNYQQALDDIDNAIRISPDNTEFSFYREVLYDALKKNRRAMSDFQKPPD